MGIRRSSTAMARASSLTAVTALGALAVAGLGASCGVPGLEAALADDAGQAAAGQTEAPGDSGHLGDAPVRTVTCTFGGLFVDQESLSSYAESGITVGATAGGWQVRTGFGHPAPSILFVTPAGASVTGQVAVTAGGSSFGFVSADLYSSTTTIPYVFAGMLGSAQLFSVSGTVPNTFGAFATVANPYPGDLIDTLVIELTNGTLCCENPMGLDNIRVTM